MPKKEKTNKADYIRRSQQAKRLGMVLQVYQLIRRGGQTIPSLAKSLGVSERTVHRYLDVLEIAGCNRSFSSKSVLCITSLDDAECVTHETTITEG